jgi:hypothetical protein
MLMNKPIKTKILIALALVLPGVVFAFVRAPRASATNAIAFPVIGSATFVNDYHYARGGQEHEAIDVMAKKGQKLIAVVDGTITRVNYPPPYWGYAIYIEDKYGFEYGYLHMNDDRPGTNDGQGGGMGAYTADMKTGNKVRKGQHIGWVGDSGLSNGVSHLHFEMYGPHGGPENPYSSLVHAQRYRAPISNYPRLTGESLPFGNKYKNGFSVATGNLDGDPESEYIVGSGPGLETSVRVYDDNGGFLRVFKVYAPNFKGGIHVSTVDINDDGLDEIVTGAGGGGTPSVKVFGTHGTELHQWYAYSMDNKWGVFVAGGDTDGDGEEEVITSLGAGAAPLVKLFNPMTGGMKDSFMAYGETTRFGTDIAAGNVTGGPADEIVTAPMKGGVPKIKIFNGDTTLNRTFYAYSEGFKGGVRVSVGNVRTLGAEEEIVTAPFSTAALHMKIFNGSGGFIDEEKIYEVWWNGYYDIAAGFGYTKAMTGVNRRVSLRPGVD